DLNEEEVADPLAPGRILSVQIGVTPQTIAATNKDAPLQAKVPVTLTGILYQIKDSDTLMELAKTFNQTTPTAILGETANQQNPLLLQQDSTILIAEPGGQNDYTSFLYYAVAGDNLEAIAAFVTVRASSLPPEAELDWYQQTIADFNAGAAIDLSTT